MALPVTERAALLVRVREIRSELPPGPSRIRELVVALERALEARAAEASESA